MERELRKVGRGSGRHTQRMRMHERFASALGSVVEGPSPTARGCRSHARFGVVHAYVPLSRRAALSTLCRLLRSRGGPMNDPEPVHDPMKARLVRGERLLGALLRMPSEELTEMVALSGFDFVLIDCEHGPADLAVNQLHRPGRVPRRRRGGRGSVRPSRLWPFAHWIKARSASLRHTSTRRSRRGPGELGSLSTARASRVCHLLSGRPVRVGRGAGPPAAPSRRDSGVRA